jgi:hypothetical protein
LPVVQSVFSCPLFVGYGIAARVSLIASLVLLALAVSPLPASAWNIPGHMLSGATAYQFLENEVVPSAFRFGTRGRSQEEGSDMLQAHENNLNLT